MIANFLNVLTSVVILDLMVLVGYICGRRGMFGEAGEGVLANIVFYVATPCVIVNSFQRPFEISLMNGFLMTCVVSAAIYAGSILLTRLTIRNRDDSTRRVMQYAAVFSNIGFMGIPVAQALYGSEGVFYVSAIMAVFNIISWTYGYSLMSASSSKISLKKMILNPGVLSLVPAQILFLTSTVLPKILAQPISYFGALNTPLGML
ncbi:MAG: AEC family transporter, partial [Oscillospiraceae bacterium]|nr:AEC family transporter [Oscillospiraceae bacterium]